jgi:hypothetical protein
MCTAYNKYAVFRADTLQTTSALYSNYLKKEYIVSRK